MPVDPDIVPLLTLIAAGTPMAELSPAEAREAFRVMTVHLRDPQTVVPVGEVSTGTVPGAEGELATRVYRPASAGPHPTVLLFHGGGFVVGDLDTHDNMARWICRTADAVVVSVDYRLAPEAAFPAAPLDAIAAARAVREDLSRLGGTEVLAVAGDSAGGNLAAVVAQQVPGIAAQLLIYPATDLVEEYPSRSENAEGYLLDAATMNWFMDHYLADGAEPADPRLSPLRGELAGLPPAVVVTAEFDPLRDEGEAYAAALTAAGVPVVLRRYDGLIHGFYDLDGVSAASARAIEESIGLFAGMLRG